MQIVDFPSKPSDQPVIRSDDYIHNAETISEITEGNDSSTNSTVQNSADMLLSNVSNDGEATEFTFMKKGLHVANLNVRHLLSKLDDVSMVLASENGPDILGLCETFLDSTTPDNLISVSDFEILRKDRGCTIDKSGGGVLLYFRNTINCRRKTELEISNIETLWSEVAFPNSKPFLLCTVYRPPDAKCDWIELFEAELSIAQTTGYEIILMGDFNINYLNCSNKNGFTW